jgi:hypothetical protein
MVHAAVPEPVLVVLEILPVNVVLVVPTTEALPRLEVQLLISVDTLARIAITLPVTGTVLDVNAVLV